MDKAWRGVDRLAHGKEPLEPMEDIPADNGADAAFINGRIFPHNLGIIGGIFVTGDDARLVCK